MLPVQGYDWEGSTFEHSKGWSDCTYNCKEKEEGSAVPSETYYARYTKDTAFKSWKIGLLLSRVTLHTRCTPHQEWCTPHQGDVPQEICCTVTSSTTQSHAYRIRAGTMWCGFHHSAQDLQFVSSVGHRWARPPKFVTHLQHGLWMQTLHLLGPCLKWLGRMWQNEEGSCINIFLPLPLTGTLWILR